MDLESLELTSTTAPGKIFHSRTELAQHYKSEWHKYNLKRREAGLPLLVEVDFQARWDAAKAMQAEKPAGTDHRKKNKQKNQKVNSKPSKETANDQVMDEPTEIDPCQSLFDRHVSESVDANVTYMYQTYGFFVPDKEFLFDLEGLVGYCHEKIKLGQECLYCDRVFASWQACQKHMIDKQHTTLGMEMEEYSDFYDFRAANQEFLKPVPSTKDQLSRNEDDKDDDEWEDINDEDGNDNESFYDLEEQVARMGWTFTPLGELVLPDGRIVGHREWRRYYKQRAPRQRPPIQQALLLEGRGQMTSTALAARGVDQGTVSNFRQWSIYRHQAVFKKQCRGEERGRRLQHKSEMNMNRMDKKGNRLMNGVSVAHAQR